MYLTENWLSCLIPRSTSTAPLATLTFNRPEARNAMTWEMYEALVAACERVDRRRRAIRVLDPARRRRQGVRRRHRHLAVSELPRPRGRHSNTRSGSTASSTGSSGSPSRRSRRWKASPPAAAAPSRSTCDLRVATPESTLRHPDRAHARQLPVRRQLQPARRSDRARAREGPAVHRPLRCRRDEAHALGLVNRARAGRRRSDGRARAGAARSPPTRR